MTTWTFRFTAAADDLVKDGQISVDGMPPYVGIVTRVYVDNLDATGAYVRNVFRAYAPGTVLYMQGTSDTFAAFKLIAPVLDRVGYLELPVSCLAASPFGLMPGPIDVNVLGAPAPVARDAATDPALVTLETAKTHLRITDTDHDVDVTQKLTAASATIRDYLDQRNDPAWTADTVPPWIAAAVLLLLAHLYEHRGDEFGGSQDNDDRVWSAIANLCRRSRDSALA